METEIQTAATMTTITTEIVVVDAGAGAADAEKVKYLPAAEINGKILP